MLCPLPRVGVRAASPAQDTFLRCSVRFCVPGGNGAGGCTQEEDSWVCIYFSLLIEMEDTALSKANLPE